MRCYKFHWTILFRQTNSHPNFCPKLHGQNCPATLAQILVKCRPNFARIRSIVKLCPLAPPSSHTPMTDILEKDEILLKFIKKIVNTDDEKILDYSHVELSGRVTPICAIFLVVRQSIVPADDHQ